MSLAVGDAARQSESCGAGPRGLEGEKTVSGLEFSTVMLAWIKDAPAHW